MESIGTSMEFVGVYWNLHGVHEANMESVIVSIESVGVSLESIGTSMESVGASMESIGVYESLDRNVLLHGA